MAPGGVNTNPVGKFPHGVESNVSPGGAKRDSWGVETIGDRGTIVNVPPGGTDTTALDDAVAKAALVLPPGGALEKKKIILFLDVYISHTNVNRPPGGADTKRGEQLRPTQTKSVLRRRWT